MEQQVLTFPRNKGSDPTHGIDFEWETTLLVYLKCIVQYEEWKRTNTSGVKSFFVANNVHGVGAFDDVVVRKEIVHGSETKTILTFTQCKHFAGKESNTRKVGNYLAKQHIQKYFDSCLGVYKIFLQDDTSCSGEKIEIHEDQETTTQLQLKSLFNCQFSDCEFAFVSNIGSLPEETFERVENNSEEHESILKTGGVATEYRLRLDKCQQFVNCNVAENDLIFQFCNKFRIFSIPGDKPNLEIDGAIRKLCSDELRANILQKTILRDMLLEETKLNFEATSLLTEKTDMLKKIKDLMYLKEVFEQHIKAYNKSIPSNIDKSLEMLSYIQASNTTEYKRLVKFRILQSFFYLNQEYLCIFVSNHDDFIKWESSRSTFTFKNQIRVYIFFENSNLCPGEEGENETFVKLVHKPGIQSESTLLQLLSEDEVNFIGNSKILFQGNEIALKDLCSNWYEFFDEDAICNILESQQLVIGLELPTGPNFYVNRKLKIKVLKNEMRNQILNTIADNCVIGSGNIILFTQMENNMDVLKKRIVENINVTIKCMENLDEVRRKIPDLVKDHKLNHYFCTYFNEQIELRYMHGRESNNLDDCIIDEQFLMTGSQKITILSDVAGMGKSTTMLKLALDYKTHNKAHWVHYIKLGNFCVDFEKASINNVVFYDAIKFLASKILKIVGIENMLFFYACVHTGKVAVFFDGYDELSPEARMVFTRYLVALEDTQISKLFVSSRQNVKDELERLIALNSIKFQEFSVEEKENCLIGIWKRQIVTRSEYIVEDRLKIIAKKVINNIKSQENAIHEILAIPLQITMFADAYYEDVLECCKADTEFDIQVDLLSLYENFIRSQVKHYYKKLISVWNDLSEHQKCRHIREKLRGVPELVCSLFIPRLVQNDTEDMRVVFDALRDDLGLITDDSQTPPSFLHKTIAEYLSAQYIVKHFRCQDSDAEIDMIFASILTEKGYDILRKFINCFLDEHKLPKYFEKIGTFAVELSASLRNDIKNSPFIVAAAEGNVNLLKALLRRDESWLNIPNCDGITPLHAACSKGKYDAVKFLLSHNCLVFGRDNNGETAFHLAAGEGHEVVLKLLLQHDKSFVNMTSSVGYTALLVACAKGKTDVVNYLLSHHCSVSERDNRGNTAYHLAAQGGHIAVLELLFQHDASMLNVRNNHGVTPLQKAIVHYHTDAVKFFLNHGCSVRNRDNDGDTAFNEAALHNNVEAMELLLQYDKSLLNQANDRGETPLHQACYEGNPEAVKFLLKNNECTKYLYNNDGKSPFKKAALRGHIRVLELFSQYAKSYLINKQNKGCNSVLYIVGMDDGNEAFSFLKSIDVSINFRDNICNRVIFYAAWREQIETKQLVLKLENWYVQNLKIATFLYLTCFKGMMDYRSFQKFLSNKSNNAVLWRC